MNIRVGDYEARPDGPGWVLIRYVVAKNGKRAGEQVERTVGFYGDLRQALFRMSDCLMAQIAIPPDSDISLVIAVIEALQADICEALRGVQNG